ncbi:MAG: phosphoenolpyruvate carboxylase [Sandaracinaceae bacterium]
MTARLEEQIEANLARLMSQFHRVLVEVGATAIADGLPWQEEWRPGVEERADARVAGEVAEQAVQAFSISLQLLARAEENALAQHRRAAEGDEGLEGESGSWDAALSRVANLSDEALAEALRRVRVEPVLTAHPTEAKRETVLEHHRGLYRLLVELENTMWTDAERAAIEERMAACLERLWWTGEIYLEKPTIADERRLVLHFLRDVFPGVVPWADRRLQAAWARAGRDVTQLEQPEAMPRLALGDWIGGDRDGHPGVTADVTAETLALFRREALTLVDARLETLARKLSLSDARRPPPESLLVRLRTWESRLGARGADIRRRNPGEPWRQLVSLLRAALPLVVMATAHWSSTPASSTSSDRPRPSM